VLSGTSMASPHVAGAAALFLQANKSASPAQVAAALINNSTPGKISDAGAGSPNRLLYTGFIGVPTPTPTTIPDRLVRMIFIRKVGAGTPTLTPTRTPTRTPTATGVACTSAVVDGGFENDSNLWTHYSSSGYSSLRCTLATCEGAIIRSGSAVAWLGGADDELSILEQQVTVPNSAAPVFSYWYNVGSQETTCGYDSAASYVKVGALEADLATHELCDSNETSGWRNQIVNLSAYAGQTVTIGFRVLTDSSVNSNFFVDDVSLYASNACLSSSVAQGDSTPVPTGEATPQPSFGNDAPRIAFP
jgi:hypothetical protein